jgi:hypothetical protein
MRDGDFGFGAGEIVAEAGGAHLIGLERGAGGECGVFAEEGRKRSWLA